MPKKVLSLVKPRSVGVWIRVSTEFQAQGDSPLHHEERAREYAESKGWTVAEVYHLEAVSGKSVLQHPEAQRMLTDIRTGKITALVISKLARLARNTRQLLEIASVFQEHGADLVSLDQPLDVLTSNGRLLLSILAALSEWEREEISSRVIASVPIRAKLGKSLGGAAPFGYQWKDNELKVDPNEAPVRKLMYELFLQNGRKKTTARLLNEKGYRTRNGSKFSDTTIDRLIRCPTAKGKRRANYTASVNGNKRHWVLKPEKDWVWVEIEAIVSVDVWERANHILDVQKGKLGRTARRSAQHVFVGATVCKCGTKMRIPSGYKNYTCQKCRNKIVPDDLEGLFLEVIRSIFNSDGLHLVVDHAQNEFQVAQVSIAELIKKRGEIRRRMDKCYDAYMSEVVTEEDFSRAYRPLRDQSEELDAQVAELQMAARVFDKKNLSTKQIAEEVKNFSDVWWPSAPFEDRRAFVENFAGAIVVDRELMSIKFRHPGQPVAGSFMGLNLICGMEVSISRISCDASGHRTISLPVKDENVKVA